MLLRVWRISTAASAVPSTNAGISMRWRFASGLSQIGTNPEAGSQPSRTEKNRISMIPSQKFGIETPQSDAPLVTTSQIVLRRTAARTPAGMAMPTATMSERAASSIVIGSFVATVRTTASRVRIDSPRSPWTARAAQRRYWRGMGSLSPYFSRTASRPAASASVPAMTRAGSPGIMRTPMKTITLITISVTTEIAARRTRNSSTAAASGSVPGRPLDADETVRHGLVPLEAPRERHDVVQMVDVDDVASRREHVDRLAVQRAPLVHVAHLARAVQERIDLLVAGERGVEAALARLVLVDVAVGVDAPAPADLERLQLAVVVVLQRGRELLGAQRDVEAGLARHLLDHLAHAALARIVDDRQLEGVAAREAGVGEQLLRAGDVASGALARLVEEHADRRDGRASRRVKAVPHHLVQRLAVDGELQRLAHARVVGERRAEIARRVLLARLVSQVDRDALVAEPRHVGQLEASFALDGGGIARPHHVHHVDVARAQVREPDVVVGNDAEDHLVELRLRRVEILGRLLDDDAVLGHALGELPRPHAHGRGAEVVAQLLHRGRRQRPPRAVGELREQRRVRRLEP